MNETREHGEQQNVTSGNYANVTSGNYDVYKQTDLLSSTQLKHYLGCSRSVSYSVLHHQNCACAFAFGNTTSRIPQGIHCQYIYNTHVRKKWISDANGFYIIFVHFSRVRHIIQILNLFNMLNTNPLTLWTLPFQKLGPVKDDFELIKKCERGSTCALPCTTLYTSMHLEL